MKRFLLTIAVALATVMLRADRNVFDMPEVHSQHIKLLAMMNAAHSQGDFHAMAALCRRGIDLQTSDNLWTYNLACALSLLGIHEQALSALGKAVALGFDDIEHIKADPDLNNIRDREEYQRILTDLQTALNSEGYENKAVRRVIALPPGKDHTILQCETNTVWSFNTGLFHTFVGLGQSTDRSVDTVETNAISAPPLVYINRDNNSSAVDMSDLPGVLKLIYSNAMIDRRLQLGTPHSLLIAENSGSLIPVVGNSSLGFIKSSYWRCQPRAIFNDPELIGKQVVMLLSNQIYCYPTYSDYRMASGDLFTANTPYYVAVSGGSGAEKAYTKAIAEAICALPGDTRRYLSDKGLLMPTMQTLLRGTQRGITGRDGYLSGPAHPAAFLPSQLDRDRLIACAARLTTNSIPPLAMIQVEDVSGLNPALDMPTYVHNESLFATHMAVVRVFRAYPYKRSYKVTVHCQATSAVIRAVLLQGLSDRVAIERSREDPRTWLVEVAHHAPFDTPTADGGAIRTTRVDIGFLAESEVGISMPAILSVCFLGNEKRVYDEKGLLRSIDYRRPTAPYTDPLLTYEREWKDVFNHDAQGRITGWTRVRPRRKKEPFTAYGDLAVAFDDKGRATRARRIKYMKRYIGNPENDSGILPSLAQVDDNTEVRYTYASDDDFIGKPDAHITPMLAPPASEDAE